MLLVAIDFEHVAVAKGFYTPLGRWLRRISSVREAAAELEEAQDASGVLTLEETERRAELQEEPPPAPRVSVGCAGGGGGGDDSGSEDDDSGSGSGSEATASESEDGEDKKADKLKDGGEDKKSDGGEAQRRPRVASSRGSSVDPVPCKRSRVAQELTGGRVSGSDASSPLPAFAVLNSELRDIRNPSSFFSFSLLNTTKGEKGLRAGVDFAHEFLHRSIPQNKGFESRCRFRP